MAAVNATDNNTTINQRLNQLSSSNTSKNNTDENLFLKILSAELQNQDPNNAKDGTEYVTQMAQFSTLQQMTNLNTTMKMSAADSFIGKIAVTDKCDQNGDPYTGKVADVIRNGSEIDLEVIVGVKKDDSGKSVPDVETFKLDDIQAVGDPSVLDNSSNAGTNILNAAALIGKMVTLSDVDNNNNHYTGKIKSISKDAGEIKVNVEISAGEVKDFPVDDITSVSDS